MLSDISVLVHVQDRLWRYRKTTKYTPFVFETDLSLDESSGSDGDTVS